MSDIVERLRFDAARCEANFSKGVASNIEEAAAVIERLRVTLRHVLQRCNDNGGEIDRELVAEINAALEQEG